ncbi:renal dipeptidase family, partial [Lactarius vividus]
LCGTYGGHHLDNSLGALCEFAALVVRYVTLTHTCHAATTHSPTSGLLMVSSHCATGSGVLVRELNRLGTGVAVNLPHTSDDIVLAALKISCAPVIWGHSSIRALHDIPRNVSDDVLAYRARPGAARDGMQVNFLPGFMSEGPDRADVKTVADHVGHIMTGHAHDYDDIYRCPTGLEDLSTYSILVTKLYSCGWSVDELRGFTGGNSLRVFAGAEDVGRKGVAPGKDL